MRKYIFLLLFLGCLSAARGQTGWQYEYWFDNDRSTLETGAGSGNSFQIEADVSGLSEGMHAIHLQTAGEDRSVPVTRYFVKMPVQSKARCWFDNDLTTLQAGVSTGEPVMLNVESLKDGFHIINIQAEGNAKGLSATKCYPFVKIPQVIGVDHMTCLCMIDDQLYKQEQVSANNGVIAWQFDVSSLPQGFHRIFVQVVTPSGAATALYQGFFFRETTKTEFGEMKCVYAIDGGNFDNVAGTLANGTFHFDLDVASLSDGLHRIAYMLSNGKGVTTKVQTQFFTKIPIGGYGTTAYWYWLNDDDANPTKVSVDPRQNPFNLVSQLQIEEKQIRSSQFDFRIVGGKPVIYAKNTFHMRFYDASGRFVDLNKDFVDERVSEDVPEAEFLQAEILNARGRGPLRAPVQTVKSVAVDKTAVSENAIKWFQLQAEPGDSLQFRLDRAATFQLFSPTGKEVYTVSGADAVVWGGIHAEENGTYYLALHDATTTYGGNLTLWYEFIDKYAVLRQDVTNVGNGGPSTITFFGNGFDDLEKVQLKLGSTTINSVEVKKSSNATTSVKFDFGGAPLGNYDAVFQFGDNEEDWITVENCITVEQAIPVFLDGYVSYAPQFLVSLGNQYDFRITNHGNMTAYDRAMKLRIFTTEASNILSVIADGIELTDFTEEVSDSLEGFPCLMKYDITRTLRPSTTETYLISVKTASTDGIYVFIDSIGGGSNPVNSLDPNDIYGYLDENGTKYIKEGLTDVYYTIEFENDPEFATAPAHDIYVTDKLNPELFDLTTYKPTRIQIGEKSAELSGDKNFVTTIDMRPQINAIAQIEGTFNDETGEVSWHISSLDPMTVEPTTEPMDGVLPVNSDGNGIGRLSFDIALKSGLAVGTEVPNKATITFDTNQPIETPTWTNIIGTAPIGSGDANGDGVVDVNDITAVVNCIQGNAQPSFDTKAADVNGDGEIDVNDITGIVNIIQQ